jgi:hypothetical protein
MRNRLRAAAERRGLKLEFIRTNGIVVRFKVVAEDGEEAIEDFGLAQEMDLAA